MAPQDKKWDDAAERDLCLAIIQGNQDGERARYNWGRICDIMHGLGYAFTKDAMAQHFTKVILKEFKGRHGAESLASSSPASKESAPSVKKTPRKKAAVAGSSAASTPKKATPASKKRSKEVAFEDDVDDQHCDDDADSTVSHSAKKSKTEPETPESSIKQETIQFDHNLAIYNEETDLDAEFNRWMNDFEQ